MTALTLTLKYQSHQYPLPMNLPEKVKEDWECAVDVPWGCPHTEKGHPCYRGTVMCYHRTGALIGDGPAVNTTLQGVQNFGRHNTAI